VSTPSGVIPTPQAGHSGPSPSRANSSISPVCGIHAGPAPQHPSRAHRTPLRAWHAWRVAAQLPRDADWHSGGAAAQRNPAYLQAVQAAYAGDQDVLNALWRAAHPEEEAPDGTPSPANRLRGLQKRVFSANGDSVGDPKATAALREARTAARSRCCTAGR
jgi:hypothetical protein